MRTLYLHIGPQKTGSTYVQKVFLKNLDRIPRAGFDYAPDADPVLGAHYKFLDALKSRDMTAVFAELAVACPGEKVLVSNEDFAKFLVSPSTRAGAEPGRLNAHDVAEAARPFFHVRLIYFARRQDYLAESHYFQGAKTWYSGTIDLYPRQNYDHNGDIAKLETVFGQENISVLIYRDGGKNDVLAALFKAMGLPVSPVIDRDIGRQNASMARRKVLFLSAVPKNRKAKPGLINPPGNNDFILDVIERSQAIADDGKRFLMSPQARRDLVADYLAGNQALAARYGIADPGGFVELPALDPNWTAPARITAAEILAVFGEVVAAYWREKRPAAALGMTLRMPALFTKIAGRTRRPLVAPHPPVHFGTLPHEAQ